MSQLVLELPNALEQKLEASGLSQEQLGQVMTYLLEMYLHVEQTNDFIQVKSHEQHEPKARKAGSAKNLGIIISDDFDKPLEDFAEYMS